MANILTTYSGKDLTGSVVNTVYAPAGIQLSGIAEVGINGIHVRMAVNQSSLQVGMDGAVVPSVIPGDNGTIEIEVWQTSTVHQQFLSLYNSLKAARDTGDVSQWFGNTIYIQNVVDGSSHYATGCGFMKIPDKAYGQQAVVVNWVFECANVISEAN
jgi:hypothetical protein